MLKTARRSIRDIAASAGVDLRRFDPLAFEHHRLKLLLNAHQVDLVLDIGANTGQWACDLRHSGYDGEMISFEPLAEAHGALVRNARGTHNWTIAPRLALGDCNAEVEINVAGNSFSSSILPMLPTHVNGAPHSAYVGTEKIAMVTLDSLVGTVIPSDCQRIFCKLDVQGFEAKVLAGAVALLERTVGLQMEMSLAPLYQGQTAFTELLETMTGLGFELFGLVPGFVDPASGRMLQVDGVFFRDFGKGSD